MEDKYLITDRIPNQNIHIETLKKMFTSANEFETAMKELSRISKPIGIFHHDTKSVKIDESIGFPFDRRELIINPAPKKPRNFIHPDMAERKFSQKNTPVTGIRIWVIIVTLATFLILTYFS